VSISLLRLPEVLSRKGDSRSSHFQQVKKGLFTPPLKLGTRTSVWPDYEVDAINAARIASWSNDEIRLLVSELIEVRNEIFLRNLYEIGVFISKLMIDIRSNSA